MKKLWLNIRIFFFYLFRGMKNVNDVAFTSQKDVDGGVDGGIEQQQEVNSVYKDMLKGELTQEVIELRHEMYFAERESKKYIYVGNGRVIKKNNVDKYRGKLETSDGLPVIIVQDNNETIDSLTDHGIYIAGNKVEYDDKMEDNLNVKQNQDYTIHITRDFAPRFRLEKYATKIVVKAIDQEHSLIDVYVPQYKAQFDNVGKMFHKQLDSIYIGENLRSDIINFQGIGFVTKNAYGADDLIEFNFTNPVFDNIIKFDGSYVLRFTADNDVYRKDLLDEIYDEETAEKNRTHAPRENNTISADVFLEGFNKDEFDVDQAQGLLKTLQEDD